MKRNCYYIVLIILGVWMLACEQKPKSSSKEKDTSLRATENKGKEFPNLDDLSDMEHQQVQIAEPIYDFKEPDQVETLPHKLVEISGLDYEEQEQLLYTVNDEVAMIYKLDVERLKVVDQVDFGSRGDYEGVEVVNGLVYIVKSNGNIYIYDPEEEDTELVKTHLKSANNVEGLGVDASGEYLLLALKGNRSIKRKDNKRIRSVYGFHLADRTLSEEPLFEIRGKDIEHWIKRYSVQDGWKEDKKLEMLDRAQYFAPSGIAVHPQTKEYYVLSHSGNLLVVLDADFQIVFIYFLDRKVLRQPEGICFDTVGHLWVSSEGAGKKARICRFDDER